MFKLILLTLKDYSLKDFTKRIKKWTTSEKKMWIFAKHLYPESKRRLYKLVKIMSNTFLKNIKLLSSEINN